MKTAAITLAVLLASAWTPADAQYGVSSSAGARRVAGSVNPPSGGSLLAGGSDDCATAEALSGTGSFPFDNSAASTGLAGQNEAICFVFGSSTIAHDVWFSWTADFDGTAQVDTCGSPVDTKIAAYPGVGCPADGTALACNDDTCGWQSVIQFDVVSGQTYTLQVGTYPSGSGGAGMLNCGPTPGVSCPVMHDGTSENSMGLTLGGDTGFMYYVDCLATIDTIEVAYGTPVAPGLIPNGSPVTLGVWNDPTNDEDPDDAVLLATIPVPAGVTNEDGDALNVYHTGGIVVTGGTFVAAVVTHAAGEFPAPLDQSSSGLGRNWIVGMTSGGFDFAALSGNDVPPLNVGAIGFDGNWLIQVSGTPIGSDPGFQYCPGDGIAPHTPCPFSNDNDGSMGGCYWGEASFPGGGVLGATGSAILSQTDTYLVATEVENDFGIFFGAANRVNGGNGNPLNDGLRCAGGSLVRLIPPTIATGNTASCGPVQTLDSSAAPGVTRRYQYWFRTPGGPGGQMANLTNGYEIAWL